MYFQELDHGNFRIYAGAMEAPGRSGYIASVVVTQVRGNASVPQELYRADALGAGYCWPSPTKALNYAKEFGLRRANAAACKAAADHDKAEWLLLMGRVGVRRSVLETMAHEVTGPLGPQQVTWPPKQPPWNGEPRARDPMRAGTHGRVHGNRQPLGPRSGT
jgi:hypothetical protein